jgi:UPF0755 protein
MKRTPIIVAGLALAVVVIVISYAAFKSYSFLNTSPESPGREVFVDVKPGSTFDQVTRQLTDKGLITNPEYFRILGKYEKKIASIKAGEFRMNTSWTPDRVLDELVSGRPVLYKLSLREGLTWWETAKVVEEAGFADSEDFAARVRDSALLKKYNIPFDTAEGFLFPETYLLKRPKKPDALPVVEMLIKEFFRQTAVVWPDGPPDAKTLTRIVALATLVEKETGAAEERRRIAGVYSNRLKRRMLMQADPTVIYGIGPAFDGNLKKVHLLDKSNPYNTYRRRGLPPGPICSPGLASIQAAANPEEHDYLYFVAKGDGTHHFSRTLKEHNRAVRKYQLRRRR